MADLGAVAIEEGDGEDLVLQGFLAPLLEGGYRQHQDEKRADDADIQPFAGEFRRQPLAAGDGEAVGEAADPLMHVGGAAGGVPKSGIDP